MDSRIEPRANPMTTPMFALLSLATVCGVLFCATPVASAQDRSVQSSTDSVSSMESGGAGSMGQESISEAEKHAERDPELGEQIREAMVQYFRDGLARQVGLDDRQLDDIVPLVRRMEADRRNLRREKTRLLVELRRAYRRDAPDDRLEKLMTQLDDLAVRERESLAETQAEIDSLLSPRQRVQFRFYSQGFRRQLEERIQDFRRNRPRPLRDRLRRSRP